VVSKIANVPRGPQDRPNDDQLIEKVELFRSASPPSA
jgi:hypothetical protein